ncbi:hypothetical protein [Paracoccus sp. ME4]|uniref:hypothetical protein n=1 Tax=Paracoccus sp. ME4 TaxID=3138066 RepID=UPI00398AD536
MSMPFADLDGKMKQFETAATDLLTRVPDLDQSDLDMLVYDAFSEQASSAVNSENADHNESHDLADRQASHVNNHGQTAQVSVLLGMGWTEDGLLDELKPDNDTPAP